MTPKEYTHWVIMGDESLRIPKSLKFLATRIEQAIKFALVDYKKELKNAKGSKNNLRK